MEFRDKLEAMNKEQRTSDQLRESFTQRLSTARDPGSQKITQMMQDAIIFLHEHGPRPLYLIGTDEPLEDRSSSGPRPLKRANMVVRGRGWKQHYNVILDTGEIYHYAHTRYVLDSRREKPSDKRKTLKHLGLEYGDEYLAILNVTNPIGYTPANIIILDENDYVFADGNASLGNDKFYDLGLPYSGSRARNDFFTILPDNDVAIVRYDKEEVNWKVYRFERYLSELVRSILYTQP